MTEQAIRVELIDFGGGSQAMLQLALQDVAGDLIAGVEFDRRSKLVPASETQAEQAPAMEPDEFDPPDAPNYLPSDPSQWAWIVGSFVTIKVADLLVADGYRELKKTLLELRKKSPTARISLDDAPLDELVDDPTAEHESR